MFDTVLLALLGIALSAYHWIVSADTVTNVITAYPLNLVLILYSFMALCLVGVLFGFHMFIIAKGVTTHEHLKSEFPHGSPHTKGFRYNFLSTCCAMPRQRFDNNLQKLGQTGEELQKVKFVDGSTMQSIAITGAESQSKLVTQEK